MGLNSYEFSNNTDEGYLVKCCKNNNPAAQKLLYKKYEGAMMILCLRYVVDYEDAKEVLMDGFYSFFKNIGRFSYLGEGSVKAWLTKILVNQCLSFLRKRKPIFSTGKDLDSYENKWAEENVLDNMNIKEIMKLVQSLPDGYRTVFNLYVFEGMNHREIGEMLEISENTSKSQLHKAREILKKKILQTI